MCALVPDGNGRFVLLAPASRPVLALPAALLRRCVLLRCVGFNSSNPLDLHVKDFHLVFRYDQGMSRRQAERGGACGGCSGPVAERRQQQQQLLLSDGERHSFFDLTQGNRT